MNFEPNFEKLDRGKISYLINIRFNLVLSYKMYSNGVLKSKFLAVDSVNFLWPKPRDVTTGVARELKTFISNLGLIL